MNEKEGLCWFGVINKLMETVNETIEYENENMSFESEEEDE